jgi:hypothetical protein
MPKLLGDSSNNYPTPKQALVIASRRVVIAITGERGLRADVIERAR